MWVFAIKNILKRFLENDIISDTVIKFILPLQINKMFARHKVMCGCECCIPYTCVH